MMQGRKSFGMPTPSLLILLLAVGAMDTAHLTSPASEERPLPNPTQLMTFADTSAEPDWIAVNDGVMGGRSQSAPRIAAGQLHFEGSLSLENNGGFASIRTVGRTFVLRNAQALVLRVLGDGRTYQLRLATDARFQRSPVSFAASFNTTEGRWTEVRIGFDQLQPTWRGNRLDGPPFDPARIEEIGLLIGDRRAGPFALSVDWIGVERGSAGLGVQALGPDGQACR